MENFDMTCVVPTIGLVLAGIAVTVFLDRHPKVKSALCGALLMVAGGFVLLCAPWIGALIVLGLGGTAVSSLWPQKTRKARKTQTSADAYLARKRQQIADDMALWDQKEAKAKAFREQQRAEEEARRKQQIAAEAIKKQRYREWKDLEAKVRWCETSRYDDERAKADYFRREARKAEAAYYACK